MPTDTKLVLPGRFDPGKKYLVEGATLLAWQTALIRDRILPGKNLRETVTPQGRIIEASAGGGGIATGAFDRIYTAADTHTYLQGGTVTAGSGTVTIADIKIIDGTTGPLGDPGDHLYIIATGDGVESDGVLLPGYDLSTATTDIAATVPSNTLPTAASPSAKLCHIDLGVFNTTTLLPSAIGNVQISHCPGSYTVTRSA